MTTATTQQLSPKAAAFAEAEELYRKAAYLVISEDRCSTRMLQKEFGIGYNKAAALVERLERERVVGPANEQGKREVWGQSPLGGADSPAFPSSELPPEDETTSLLCAGRIPVKQTEEDRNVSNVIFQGTADELRQFIAQYEQLEVEKKDIAEQQKDVMGEAKARGYDTKIIKKIIALRKRDQNDIDEEEAILELYKAALGMS
ncbi:GapR family DNA-binding domain-containing protein [Frigidibacter sp. MR17.14]|uniref:GapR family DNA-binding domain-containing protein n=1 Tax=Frigidibacter sp. MR17.14 TaxID=3126509 RepID=UPI0030130F12